MAVTIIDVAKYAGVSKTTVSAVLCEKKCVREETRQKVLEAIRELNYIPNFNARNFVQKKTNILGALIMTDYPGFISYEFDSETGVFSQDVLKVITRSLSTTNYGLITEYLDPYSNVLPLMIRDRRIDGLFLIGALKSGEKILDNLLTMEIPIVLIGDTDPKFDSFRVDIVQSTYLAAKYLLSEGHRNIALINCPEQYSSNRERLIGYKKALEEAGLRFTDGLVVSAAQNTGKEGYLAASKLINSGIPTDSVICANVSITMGALRYFYENNIRIPRDISVVGHEDSVFYGYSSPGISAVNINKENTGKEALELMLERLSKSHSGEPVCRIIEPTLIKRASVRRI